MGGSRKCLALNPPNILLLYDLISYRIPLYSRSYTVYYRSYIDPLPLLLTRYLFY
nr:hypothetical protein Q903MT_gene2691 [Picea sitchensis]